MSPSAPVAFVPKQKLTGTIRPPGSKSITNRAFICAALSQGRCLLKNVLWSEDTEVMLKAWQKLGINATPDHDSFECIVEGTGGILPERKADLYVANSGTTIRFLTAALAACRGEFTLDGVPRMRERPIGDLLTSLNSMGAKAQSLNANHPDCPPIRLVANGFHGGAVQVAGNVSSQFLSGLMMACPLAKRDVQIEISGGLVSRPYVEMTAHVMKSFGVRCEVGESNVSIPAPQTYQPCEYSIEPDASAASYYFAAAAITGGTATVQGLSKSSLQGDVQFASVLEKMGCKVTWNEDSITVTGGELSGIEVDMSEISDTVQTLAAVAVFAKGKTTVRGVEHNRFKETDRISDLARELQRLNMDIEEFRDGFTLTPKEIKPTLVRTYNDHRMAMSLSLIGLRMPGVWIENPGCTAKTYPHYFEDMCRCFNLEVQNQ